MRIEMVEYMSDADASEYQLWLQLKHEHPEITQEEASKLLTFDQFIEMNKALELEKEDGEENPPGKS